LYNESDKLYLRPQLENREYAHRPKAFTGFDCKFYLWMVYTKKILTSVHFGKVIQKYRQKMAQF